MRKCCALSSVVSAGPCTSVAGASPIPAGAEPVVDLLSLSDDGIGVLVLFLWTGAVHRLTDLAMAICGSATAFAAVRFWASKAKLVMKALSWIGRYTLELYAVHVSLLLAFRIGFRNWPLTFLLWCCLSGVIIALLGRVPFLACVAFGRKWNLPFKRRSATVEL